MPALLEPRRRPGLGSLALLILALGGLLYFSAGRWMDLLVSAVASSAADISVRLTGVHLKIPDRVEFQSVYVSDARSEPWLSSGKGDLRLQFGPGLISGVEIRFFDIKIEPALSSRVNFSGKFRVDHGVFNVQRSKEATHMLLTLFSKTGPLLRASWEMAYTTPHHG